jgi:pectate lyase
MKVTAVFFSCLALTSAFALPADEVPGQEKHSSSHFGSFDLVGYARDNPVGKTTGGEKGEVVTVTDGAALIAAVTGTTPRTIYVEGRIDLPSRLRVGSNKSILGVGENAEIRQSGITVINATNVVIRNLAIRFIVNNDGITIQNSTRVWIDHNEFESEFSPEIGPDYYDGQLDTVRGSDWITISWNYFHDHWKSNLMGNSDALRDVDLGKLHLTYHHNYWVRLIIVSQYYPSHLSNSYFSHRGTAAPAAPPAASATSTSTTTYTSTTATKPSRAAPTTRCSSKPTLSSARLGLPLRLMGLLSLRTRLILGLKETLRLMAL